MTWIPHHKQQPAETQRGTYRPPQTLATTVAQHHKKQQAAGTTATADGAVTKSLVSAEHPPSSVAFGPMSPTIKAVMTGQAVPMLSKVQAANSLTSQQAAKMLHDLVQDGRGRDLAGFMAMLAVRQQGHLVSTEHLPVFHDGPQKGIEITTTGNHHVRVGMATQNDKPVLTLQIDSPNGGTRAPVTGSPEQVFDAGNWHSVNPAAGQPVLQKAFASDAQQNADAKDNASDIDALLGLKITAHEQKDSHEPLHGQGAPDDSTSEEPSAHSGAPSAGVDSAGHVDATGGTAPPSAHVVVDEILMVAAESERDLTTVMNTRKPRDIAPLMARYNVPITGDFGKDRKRLADAIVLEQMKAAGDGAEYVRNVRNSDLYKNLPEPRRKELDKRLDKLQNLGLAKMERTGDALGIPRHQIRARFNEMLALVDARLFDHATFAFGKPADMAALDELAGELAAPMERPPQDESPPAPAPPPAIPAEEGAPHPNLRVDYALPADREEQHVGRHEAQHEQAVQREAEETKQVVRRDAAAAVRQQAVAGQRVEHHLDEKQAQHEADERRADIGVRPKDLHRQVHDQVVQSHDEVQAGQRDAQLGIGKQ